MDKYLIAINKYQKIGPQKLRKLFSYFENAEEIWRAAKNDLLRSGLDEKYVEGLILHIKNTDPEKEKDYLERLEINTVSIFDKNYPLKLKEIFSPPFVLYVRGELKEDEYSIGVVGSRKPTDYGAQATKDIVRGITENNVTVVSGLALGIDTIAHQTAVLNNGRTIAVLGNGLPQIYPTSNTELAQKIIEKGAVITEYPPGTSPLKQNFPVRNRIISGLSLGVLVTEAAENSGSLITAGNALEQNREVFAVPGNIYNKNAKGVNSLIKMGAKPVTEAKDILEELNLNFITEKEKAKKIHPSTHEEAVILEAIETEPKHIDEIIKITKIGTNKISSTLTLMEIKGKIKHLGGMVYRINT